MTIVCKTRPTVPSEFHVHKINKLLNCYGNFILNHASPLGTPYAINITGYHRYIECITYIFLTWLMYIIKKKKTLGTLKLYSLNTLIPVH